MSRSRSRRAFFLTGLVVAAAIATACSSNTEAAGAGWTFGPTLSSSPGPSGAASPSPSGPTASDFASAFPSGAMPGGSPAPVGTIGPTTSSAPEPSGAPGS